MLKTKLLFFFLLTAACLFVPPNRVYAESKTLNATKDTFANEAYPDQNRGTTASVIVSNNITTRLGYILFENPDLPEGAIIDRAILRFYAFELHYADTAKVNIGPISGDWEENALTWNSKPTINQTQAVEAEISLTEQGWKEASITHMIRQWNEGALDNKGLFIYPLGYLYGTAETDYAFTFRSREASENHPVINIDYHFEEAPTTEPTPTLTPTPTLEPLVSPTYFPSPTTTDEEGDVTPTEAEEKEATDEADMKKGKVLGLPWPVFGITVLGLLALVGSGVGMYIHKRKKRKKSKPGNLPPAPKPTST